MTSEKPPPDSVEDQPVKTELPSESSAPSRRRKRREKKLPSSPNFELGPILKKTANAIIQEGTLVPKPTRRNPTVPLADSLFVIKRIDLSKFQDLDLITREVQIMSQLNHPNVINYHSCSVQEDEVWIAMKKYDFGLSDLVQPNGLRDYLLLANIFRYILTGLSYLHEHNIIHRDLKGGNVLLNKTGQVVLADFGVSKQFYSSSILRPQASSFVGTPCWMSPEMCECLDYNYLTDIWSLGITLIEGYFGRPPYVKFPAMKVCLLILNNNPPVPEKSELAGRTDLHNFLTACLQRDPQKRPNTVKLLNHRYIKTNIRPDSYLCNELMKVSGK